MAYKSPPLVVDCGDGVTISVFSYHRCARCYEVDKPSIDGERFPYIFSLYFSPTGLCIVIYTPEIPGILPFHLYWRHAPFLTNMLLFVFSITRSHCVPMRRLHTFRIIVFQMFHNPQNYYYCL